VTDHSKAIEDIAAERRRQIEVEGWSAEHDDAHIGGELAEAGAAYAMWAARYVHNADSSPAGDNYPRKPLPSPPTCWPWSLGWWKPRDFRRDLVRAGALIAAEIERHDRATKVAREEKNEREMAQGERCDGRCKDSGPCNC
jgi:hypothetical protein